MANLKEKYIDMLDSGKPLKMGGGKEGMDEC